MESIIDVHHCMEDIDDENQAYYKDKLWVNVNQAQLSLVYEDTLRVYGHSNGQKSPLSFVALTMSHRIIFYDNN